MRKFLSISLIATLLFSCDIKKPITNQFTSGVTVTWNNLHAGEEAPTNYTVQLGAESYDLTATNNTISGLLPTTDAEVTVYNRSSEIKVEQDYLVLRDSKLLGGSLYGGIQLIDISGTEGEAISLTASRASAPLKLRLVYSNRAVSSVTGISFTYNGISQARSLSTGEVIGSLSSTTSTSDLGAEVEYIDLDYHLMGVSNEPLTLDITLTLGDGSTIYQSSDITSFFSTFNSTLEPIALLGTLNLESGEVTNWGSFDPDNDPNSMQLLDITATNYPVGNIWKVRSEVRPSNEDYIGLKEAIIASGLDIEVIMEDVETIDSEAFDNYEGRLVAFSAPIATEFIWSPFNGCKHLRSISFPELLELENNDFANCTSLELVDLPKLTKTGIASFENCTSLVSISLPELLYLNSSAFVDCTSLEQVYLPKVTRTGIASFENCTSLVTVSLLELLELDNETFKGCTSLEQVELPKLTQIGIASFSNCSALTSLDLPKVHLTDWNCFEHMTSLRSISIGTQYDGAIEDIDIHINLFNYITRSSIDLITGYGEVGTDGKSWIVSGHTHSDFNSVTLQ